MSHFYGSIKGSRGEATRCGTKTSGLMTYTASWEGAIQVFLYYDDESGEDWVRVAMCPWRGAGTTRTIYSGPVGKYQPTIGPEGPNYNLEAP